MQINFIKIQKCIFKNIKIIHPKNFQTLEHFYYHRNLSLSHSPHEQKYM
jgi:hypothetical protein